MLSVPAPRRLRFKVLSSSKLLISWKEPKGDFDSYLFLYKSVPGRIIQQHTHLKNMLMEGFNYAMFFLWGEGGLSERHSNLVLISFNLKDLRKRLLRAVEVSQSFLQLCQVRDKVFPGVCQQIWKCRADRKQRWQDLQHDRVQSGTGESKGILSSCSFSI